MAADVGVLVGANDHRHGVPADVGVNLDFHVRVARVLGLMLGRNGVDVFGIGRIRNIDTVLARLPDQLLDQKMGTIGTFLCDDAFQCLHPFTGFLGVCIHGGGLWILLVGHCSSPKSVSVMSCLLRTTTLTPIVSRRVRIANPYLHLVIFCIVE